MIKGEVVRFEIMILQETLLMVSWEIAVNVKLDEIEYRLEKRVAAGQLLDLRKRAAPVRQQLAFGGTVLAESVTVPSICGASSCSDSTRTSATRSLLDRRSASDMGAGRAAAGAAEKATRRMRPSEARMRCMGRPGA